ncbi:MAG: hypothetical protein ED555_08875 [Allomuricauda sp.]|nr:MAG: hypothetical protein ED555_08875 [Allomuricauda sp.]
MKRNPIFVLSLLLVALISSCDDCNDCLDLQQKNILVLDTDGNNLLFGIDATFDPSTLTLNLGDGSSRSLFIDEESQTISFTLEENETTYMLQFDNETLATIVFELGERKSERCCGNLICSTTTLVNGASVENLDTITIVN